MESSPSPDYEARLRAILTDGNWEELREFTREQNEIPDDIYDQGEHFWLVLLHKLTCNRLDTLALADRSRTWLAQHGYTTDLGGY